MTTTNVGSDYGAVSYPQDTGTGQPSNADASSAYVLAKLASHIGGSYVDQEENPNSLGFANVSISNDTADVLKGVCYIIDDSTSTDSDRNDTAGDPTLQSTRTSGFDTRSPTRQPYLVILPTSVTGISLDTSSVNDVYLSVNPTAQNDVTLHYGSSISEPSEPSLKLGTIDTSDGSTTRPNDNPTISDLDITGTLTLSPVASSTETFTSAETKASLFSLDQSDRPFVVTASPANDPDNDHGYQVDKQYWDDSAGNVQVSITETENAGGGDADIVVWSIQT